MRVLNDGDNKVNHKINILKACLTAKESATAVEVGLGVWVAQ